MFRLILYCVLSLLLAEQTVAEGCHQEGKGGCKVHDGHAQCKWWCIGCSVDKLPLCTTKITISGIGGTLRNNEHILWNMNTDNFIRYENLQELGFYTIPSQHSQVILIATESTGLSSLNSIKILRFRVFQPTFDVNNGNLNMYSNLKSLRILDLTRAKSIGLDNAKHIIGAESSIEVLILKNIQEIKRPRNIYSIRRYSAFCVSIKCTISRSKLQRPYLYQFFG